MLGIPAGILFLVGQASQPDQTQEELQAALQSGKLVLVAFHSKGCKYCKADEPVVEELAEKLAEILVVVRVDTGTQFGKKLAQQVGVRGVPSYFLLDSVSGEMIYTQQGSLQVDRLVQAIVDWTENGGTE